MERVIALAITMSLAIGLASAGALAEPARWQPLDDKPACLIWNKGPQPQETVTWTGSCMGGRAEGNGVLVFRFERDCAWVSSRYEGDLRGGLMHGYGIYVWPDGNRYEGDWQDGYRHGLGLYVWANGDRCEGPFVDGKIHGIADCTFANGRSGKTEWRRDAFVRWVD